MNVHGRAVIINGVLLSGLWYFLSIWGGTDAGVSKIRGQLFNFLWAGDSKRGRNRVNWLTCCQSKVEGVLGLINPEDAVVALMTKWLVKACEPLATNLHVMLRYRLSHFQPFTRGHWQPSMEFFTLSSHQSRKGSKIWNWVVAAWEKMLPDVSFVEP